VIVSDHANRVRRDRSAAAQAGDGSVASTNGRDNRPVEVGGSAVRSRPAPQITSGIMAVAQGVSPTSTGTRETPASKVSSADMIHMSFEELNPEAIAVLERPAKHKLFCSRDGILLASHPRCSECFALLGTAHNEPMQADNLCSSCRQSHQPPPRLRLKGCHRCGGDLFLEDPPGAIYLVCLQCGYEIML